MAVLTPPLSVALELLSVDSCIFPHCACAGPDVSCESDDDSLMHSLPETGNRHHSCTMHAHLASYRG